MQLHSVSAHHMDIVFNVHNRACPKQGDTAYYFSQYASSDTEKYVIFSEQIYLELVTNSCFSRNYSC